MTSTSVKDVGSAFANLYASSTHGTGNSAGATSFQQVWNSQVSKEDSGFAADVQTVAEEAELDCEAIESDKQVEKPENQGEEIGVEKESAVESDVKTQPQSNTSENDNSEYSEEELRAAMEVLSAAATELMQTVAETFGVTMEELQAMMNQLGMTATDVLDGAKLGELMLQLGGASDSYALVTDETLYDNYRMVMNAQKVTLEAVAKELGVEPEQLGEMIAEELQGGTAVAEDLPDEMLKQNVETDSDSAASMVETSEEMTGVKTAEDANQSAADGQTNKEQAKTGEATNVGQNAEVVNQNVTADSFRPEIQQTENSYTSAAWDADTQNIMRQIMDYMKIQVNAETTSLEMQLHPASLGTIRVNIASNGGVVTASFLAQNEAVKAALESQIVQLRETFAEQGVKIEAIEVAVQTHEFEQNLEQGRGRNAQENGTRRNRTRRINLNDPISMEIMGEEDVLAAEMLTAGGSTVDYTA